MTDNYIRLLAYLMKDHPTIKQRIDSKDLRVIIGDNTWPSNYYRDPYFNRSVPLMTDLVTKVPEIKLVKLYYYRFQDCFHIRFEYKGNELIVEWYKIYTIWLGNKHWLFNREAYGIPDWIKNERYETSKCWMETDKNPFNDAELTKYLLTLDDGNHG